jgi:general secretion pathway protein L
MSLLIILLPARRHWHPLNPTGTATPSPAAADTQAPAPAPAHEAALQTAAAGGVEYSYALSADGRSLQSEGRCAAALLPRATSTVLVVGDTDISFHALACPKAPANRLRAALGGMLEEQLLDEPETLHLALAPDSRAGLTGWVACCDRLWLAHAIDQLERTGLSIDRVVPLTAPAQPPGAEATPAGENHLHLQAAPTSSAHESDPTVLITCSDSQGVSTWPARGALARSWWQQLEADTRQTLRLSASPAVAGAAERWLGQPVQVLPDAQRLLAASAGSWQLRQFELAPRHRGVSALRDGWRRFLAPDWKPVRVGLAVLLVAQVVGLNLWAWHERQGLRDRQAAIVQVLRSTHPQVRAILDAPLQMQRENETLRARAGRAGDSDLETLMQAAASAWPDQSAVQSLRYSAGELTLTAPSLSAERVQQLRDTLQPAGWRVDSQDHQLTLRRATRPSGPPQGRGPDRGERRPPRPGNSPS